MTLLYLALAYMTGIFLGRLVWMSGYVGCDTPAWLWLIPGLLLPIAPLLNRLHRSPVPPMRWSSDFGFKLPRSILTPGLIGAILLCAGMGVARYASHPLTPCLTPQDLAYWNLPAERIFDRDAPSITLEGYISSYPLHQDTRQRLEFTATHIRHEDDRQPVTGVVRINTGGQRQYAYGQVVRVEGRMTTPRVFPDFSYRDYLAQRGIGSEMYNAHLTILPGESQANPLRRTLYGLRARGESLLNRTLPEPYAALANGVLLGIEAGIPDELYERFNQTGASHVIVISGSNVALLAGILVALGHRLLGRRRALYPALAGIAAYALLVGGDAAVLRAALMGGLVVIAAALNRPSAALVSLGVACWMMTLVNPLTLWGVGFQLSSAATAGLILFAPLITALFARILPGFARGPLATSLSGDGSRDRAPAAPSQTEGSGSLLSGVVADGIVLTVAANLTTLPLVIYHFGRLSTVSLLTNFLIAPVQPLTLLWGSAALVCGALGLTLPAQGLLWMTWLPLYWTVWVVEWTASLPGASLTVAHYGPGALALTYGVLLIVYWAATQRERVLGIWERWRIQGSGHFLRPAAVGVMAVPAILLWWAVVAQPDGRLHLYFLDVGQGDGIFLQTPNGRQMLIDGGNSPQQLLAELGAVMPFWDRSIDLLILTHPDSDHMDAQVEIPRRFTVDRAIQSAYGAANPESDGWQTSMAVNGVAVTQQHAGGWIDLGDGVALWTLSPAAPPDPLMAAPDSADGSVDDNDNSLVVKVVYGDFRVLLTGDAGASSEAEWLRAGVPLAATVLKVGHHGSDSSTTTPFVEAVNPIVAVIQVGENRYGHPTETVLQNLSGRQVLRNDLNGRVHVWSDGRQIWVETER